MANKNIDKDDTQDEKLQKQEVVTAEVLNPTTTQKETEQKENQESQVGGESNEEFNERVKNHIAELPKTQEEQVSKGVIEEEAEKKVIELDEKSTTILEKLLETRGEQNHNSEKQKGEPEEKDPKNVQTPKVEKKSHFIDAYKRAYPKEKLFYVTSDKQVFLAKDKHLAKFHQKSLKGGEIETIKVK